jgi:hypothetical protein
VVTNLSLANPQGGLQNLPRDSGENISNGVVHVFLVSTIRR